MFRRRQGVPRVDEIAALRDAVATVVPAAPFWISCLYPGGRSLPDGPSPEAAVAAMLDPAVAPAAVPWDIGINCTKAHHLGPLVDRYEAAVADMRRRGLVRDWPALVLYPDGTNGQVYDTAAQRWVDAPGAAAGGAARLPWERQVADVVEAAEARGRWRQIIVGGCCMASCHDVARLRSLLVPP